MELTISKVILFKKQKKKKIKKSNYLHILGDYTEDIINWIPKELPPYVRIVLSFNHSNEKGQKLSNYVTKNFGKNNTIQLFSILLQIQNSDKNLMQKFIESSTKNQNRGNLSEDLVVSLMNFFTDIINRCLSSLNPLLCKMLLKYYEHVITFKTFQQLRAEPFDPNSDLYTCLNFKVLLDRIFSMLERKYGDVLVRRALGYIGAFHYCGGCTENELLDLLSLDDSVLASINSESLPYKCVPEIYWITLKAILVNLDFLLEAYNPGGYLCILFKHTLIYEAIYDRYFMQRDKAASYHKAILNYYSNKHERINILQAIKQPIEQTIILNEQKRIKIPNMRRLNLFGFHLSLSAPTVDCIKEELMFNYKYLESKY